MRANIEHSTTMAMGGASHKLGYLKNVTKMSSRRNKDQSDSSDEDRMETDNPDLDKTLSTVGETTESEEPPTTDAEELRDTESDMQEVEEEPIAGPSKQETSQLGTLSPLTSPQLTETEDNQAVVQKNTRIRLRAETITLKKGKGKA